MSSWIYLSILSSYKILAIIMALVLANAIVIFAVYSLPRWSAGLRRYPAAGAGQTFGGAGMFFNIFAMGLVGGLAGHLGGGSRESVVGELVPAVFTLFGGYLAYYLGEKKDVRGTVVINSISFVFCFFSMYTVAATWRQSNENWHFCRDLYSNHEFATPEKQKDRDANWEKFCQPVFNEWTQN